MRYAERVTTSRLPTCTPGATRSKQAIVLATLVWTAAVSCARNDQPQPIEWRHAADALDYAVVHGLGRQSGARFVTHVLRFDPKKWRSRAATPAVMGAKTSDIAAFRRKLGGVAAINGGFFDPELRPLGLLVSDGVEVSRLRKVDHGVFTIANGVPAVQHARQFVPPAGLDFAVECGPRLVVDSKPLSFKPGVARRTAIGHDRDGRAFWIVSAGPMTLGDLAEFVVSSRARGGLGVVDALNLDGGKSTVFDLDVTDGERKTTGSVRSSLQVPVGIVLVRDVSAL